MRLLNASGEETATNIFAGRGACTGALSKSMQAKTIIPLRDTGEYTIEIRDATADFAGPDFTTACRCGRRCRTSVTSDRRDHLNLAPGEAKTMRVTFDREEDYRGAVAVIAESLPQGLSAAAGADYEPDTDPSVDRQNASAIRHGTNELSWWSAQRRTPPRRRPQPCSAWRRTAGGWQDLEKFWQPKKTFRNGDRKAVRLLFAFARCPPFPADEDRFAADHAGAP